MATALLTKVCEKCGKNYATSKFLPSRSRFSEDKLSPFCITCATTIIKTLAAEEEPEKKEKPEWNGVNKLCQFLDFPFVPSVLDQFSDQPLERALIPYFSFFQKEEEYSELNWKVYNDAYLELREKGTLEDEVPLVGEKKRLERITKWGDRYSETEYQYLEDLYQGVLDTQPVSSPLIEDNARKICLVLLLIDEKIREGQEFDKLLKSYDSLMKIAGFSAKESKETGEIESVGEVAAYLEKKGWMNKYHQDEPKDIVDLTIAEIQLNNQRLYTNEPGIGEEITSRIQNLKSSIKLEEDIDGTGEYKTKEGKSTAEIDYEDPFLLELDAEDFAADLEEEEEE